MAEALVFSVLLKIGAVIGEEVVKAGSSKLLKGASDLRNIQSNIMHIQSEFTVMQAFLRKADVQTDNNETFEAWLGEVRKVANNVEDIIDEYAYLIVHIEGSSNSVSKTFRNIKNSTSWYEISTQLEKVKNQVDHLTKMRECYGITISDVRRSNNDSPNAWRRPDLSAYLNAVVEAEVVGNMKERAQLSQWLLEEELGRVVISVFGMGGLGKTTLVNAIYKREEIKRNFDCCACVSVSQSFKVEDLLRSISKQIFPDEANIQTEIDRMDHINIVDRLQRYMQNKSYLIVLDDMWEKDAWLSMSHAFPVNNCRGKVVITTRMKDVALLADENSVIELTALSEDESWDLFCTKAFRKLREKICPSNLVAWAKKILDKCQGLPLAIVAIGSLLSFKERTEMEWRMFYDQLSWELSNNPELVWVTNILNLSYNNLPTYLKNCFLYCSLFPEDSAFEREEIIRLCVAEGFVEQRGRETTLEEVAEAYLVELANRSLLQVVERDENGRAESYRMHDLIRGICIATTGKELFGIVCDNKYLTDLKRTPRRVTVQSQCENLQLDGGSSKLRSFLLFNKQLPSSRIETALSNFKLMCVLSLKSSNIVSLPDAVFELFNLHYLDLSRTKIKVISKSLGRLKLLQTLNLEETLVKQLPHEITKLTKLRHLIVFSLRDFQIFDWCSGVPVPVEICGLKDLQTLDAIEANQNLVSQLGSLAMLRTIYLSKVKGSYISSLWLSFSKMPHLTHLGIYACDEDEVLNFEGLKPFLPSLKIFALHGKLEGGVIPSIFSSFGNIRVLMLRWSGLRVDPLSSISHISNLTHLSLIRAYEGEVLIFCSGWFPNLKRLHLVDLLNLTQINFEEGTTPSIKNLILFGLSNLTKVPEGVRYLCSLQKMVIWEMPVEFVENIRGDGQAIVRHIPAIKVF